MPLPAVISITEALPDARFPNFKGIMAAKKKPLEVVSLADLGVSADPAEAPQTILTAVAAKPPRAAGVKITDEGDAAAQLVEFLVAEQAGVSMAYPENPILVLVDVTPAGAAAPSTAGLLGAAAQLGAPVALVAAPAGTAQAAVDAVVAAGAQVVLTADVDGGSVTVAVVDALQAAYRAVQPGCGAGVELDRGARCGGPPGRARAPRAVGRRDRRLAG